MPDEVVTYRDRAAELELRIRRDIDLLTETHHQLTIGLSRMMGAVNEAPRPSPPAIPDATASASTRPSTGPRFIRLKELAPRIGVERSRIWRMVKDGTFPKPRRISMRAVGWLDDEIAAWMAGRRPFDETPNVHHPRRK